MKTTFLIVSTIAVLLGLPLIVIASDRDDDVGTPDKGIPNEILGSAKYIANIPGDKEFTFISGGKYGRGLAPCQTEHGCSSPMFVAEDGGNAGCQIGGSLTDLVMILMSDRALRSLLGAKLKLGADASVAAGPVGRHAAAGTDLRLSAEILSYWRAKGISAGISLGVAVVQADKTGDKAMHGDDVNRREILNGKIPAPDSVWPLLREIGRYVKEAKA